MPAILSNGEDALPAICSGPAVHHPVTLIGRLHASAHARPRHPHPITSPGPSEQSRRTLASIPQLDGGRRCSPAVWCSGGAGENAAAPATPAQITQHSVTERCFVSTMLEVSLKHVSSCHGRQRTHMVVGQQRPTARAACRRG